MSQKSFSGSFSTPVGKREGGTLQEELQGLTWDGMLEKQRLSEKRRKSSVGTDPGSPSKAKANSQADGEHSGHSSFNFNFHRPKISFIDKIAHQASNIVHHPLSFSGRAARGGHHHPDYPPDGSFKGKSAHEDSVFRSLFHHQKAESPKRQQGKPQLKKEPSIFETLAEQGNVTLIENTTDLYGDNKELDDKFKQLVANGVPVFKGVPGSTHAQPKSQSEERKNLPAFIFHPFSIRRLFWDALMLLLLFYSLLAVPYFLAFDSKESNCENNGFLQQDRLFYVDFFFDCLFLIDIVVAFRTAYYDVNSKSALLVTDPVRIAKNYFFGFFFIDLMSSIPYDAILLSSCGDTSGANRILKSPKVFKLLKVIRMSKVARVSRLQNIIVKVKDVLRLNPGAVRLASFLAGVIILCHYNACIFFWIGEFWLDLESDNPGDRVSWTTEVTVTAKANGTIGQVPVTELDPSNQYMVSIYWAIATITTTGYGDVVPYNVPEVMFVILVLLQGGAIFSIIIANVAKLFNTMNMRYTMYKEDLEEFDVFMHNEDLPPGMRNQIREFKKHNYLNPSRRMPLWATENLSNSLLRDITMHLYRRSILHLKFFRGLSEECITALALELVPVQYAPGEVLYYEGGPAEAIYFMQDGEVELSILMLSDLKKELYGSKIIPDPAVSDCYENLDNLSEEDKQTIPRNQKFRKLFPDGSVHWTGKMASTYQFFRWIVDTPARGTLGAGCVLGNHDFHKTTAVTKAWSRFLVLRRESIQKIASQFEELKNTMYVFKHRDYSLLRTIVRKMIDDKKMLRPPPVAILRVELCATINVPLSINTGRVDSFMQVDLIDIADPNKKRYPSKSTLIQFNDRNPWFGEVFSFHIMTIDEIKSGNLRVMFTLKDFQSGVEAGRVIGKVKVTVPMCTFTKDPETGADAIVIDADAAKTGKAKKKGLQKRMDSEEITRDSDLNHMQWLEVPIKKESNIAGSTSMHLAPVDRIKKIIADAEAACVRWWEGKRPTMILYSIQYRKYSVLKLRTGALVSSITEAVVPVNQTTESAWQSKKSFANPHNKASQMVTMLEEAHAAIQKNKSIHASSSSFQDGQSVHGGDDNLRAVMDAGNPSTRAGTSNAVAVDHSKTATAFTRRSEEATPATRETPLDLLSTPNSTGFEIEAGSPGQVIERVESRHRYTGGIPDLVHKEDVVRILDSFRHHSVSSAHSLEEVEMRVADLAHGIEIIMRHLNLTTPDVVPEVDHRQELLATSPSFNVATPNFSTIDEEDLKRLGSAKSNVQDSGNMMGELHLHGENVLPGSVEDSKPIQVHSDGAQRVGSGCSLATGPSSGPGSGPTNGPRSGDSQNLRSSGKGKVALKPLPKAQQH